MPEIKDHPSPSLWVEREGHTLFLNGRSIHTVTIFNVRIYEISLFLEKRSQDAEKILDSPHSKLILLEFLRDISADQLRSALSDGFLENCATQCDQMKPDLNLLSSKIPDFKEGDTLEFQFLPDKLILRPSRGNYLELNSPSFERVILSIWLGISPPSPQMKKEILGIN